MLRIKKVKELQKNTKKQPLYVFFSVFLVLFLQRLSKSKAAPLICKKKLSFFFTFDLIAFFKEPVLLLLKKIYF
jgi:hypothetical protein